MQFEQFATLVAKRFTEIQLMDKLFVSSINGYKLSDIYLKSFKPEHNQPFRDPESTVNNCNLDKAFIRRYGNVVAVDVNNNIITMWDVEVPEDSEYYGPSQAMSKALKEAPIQEVFFETFTELNSLPYEKNLKKSQDVFRLGVKENFKRYTQEEVDKFPNKVNTKDVYKFSHFYGDLSGIYVDTTGKSQAALQGQYRDAKNVFKRGLDEIPLDTFELVQDLINQGSLLDGDTHIQKIKDFVKFKKVYDKLSEEQKDNWAWITSYNLPIAKFRNELIGTLCAELAEGMELNKACQNWNKRVDPANYMKATAPITKRQIQEAQKFVEDNGYTESFNRRFATIDDINVDEIMHKNADNNKAKTASIFDSVKPAKSTRHKRSEFEGIEEVSIEKFMNDILPGCTGIEAFLENRMDGNFVTLTTANVLDSKPIFKWNNNFSWTYNGNLAGKSQITENVKKVGGKTDGALRCSLQWNDEDTKGLVDMDLHVNEKANGRSHIIYYGDKRSRIGTGGWLDIDMINPSDVGIENMTYGSIPPNGTYEFLVNCFNGQANKGFKAEILMNGEIFQYHHARPMTYKQQVKIATVTILNGQMTIVHHLAETNSSKTVWGLETNQFHKVNLVCLSPNHWADNNTGNKHYFFMLDKAASDTAIRSFHIENLIGDLATHRKVLEVLGATTMLEPTAKQLAGLGFNATVKDELILKLSGTFKRTIKVKF